MESGWTTANKVLAAAAFIQQSMLTADPAADIWVLKHTMVLNMSVLVEIRVPNHVAWQVSAMTYPPVGHIALTIWGQRHPPELFGDRIIPLTYHS